MSRAFDSRNIPRDPSTCLLSRTIPDEALQIRVEVSEIFFAIEESV
jgi:hypothetical protein